MANPGVQLVREWLRRQPFSLRLLTLLLFLVEAVEEEFGEEVKKSFENDLREATRKIPLRPEKDEPHEVRDCWCGANHRTVTETMVHRARDLFRKDGSITTERVAHALFEEYSDLAKQFGVTPEALHSQSSEIACEIAEALGFVAKWKAEEKDTVKKK
jgi:hypothetical protein